MCINVMIVTICISMYSKVTLPICANVIMFIFLLYVKIMFCIIEVVGQSSCKCNNDRQFTCICQSNICECLIV